MEKKHFFDKPENVRNLLRALYAVCALLIVIDFFIPKHGYILFENAPQFFAAYGLVAYITIVFTAKYILRSIAKRKEDYYDD
ncbi:MAG: hypothetical protein KAR83_09055 [Thermodesulfovibrionales bacterium]|nr:hypothetical protein [Thermodesulfovibrionales bacterium]